MTRRTRLRKIIATLRRNERGVALVEFAYVLPVLLVMFLGAYEFSDAIACSRKVTITARAVADLTSQYSLLTGSQTDTLLNASGQIMAPYPASKALVRVTELTTDKDGNTTVTWSRAIHGERRNPGDAFTLPKNIMVKSSSLILGEVAYAYTPVANVGSLGSLSLTQSIYMVPRVSSTVTCNDCNS